MKLREIVWALVFFADSGADERSSCGLVLAAVVVGLGVVAMLVLGQDVLAGWAR